MRRNIPCRTAVKTPGHHVGAIRCCPPCDVYACWVVSASGVACSRGPKLRAFWLHFFLRFPFSQRVRTYHTLYLVCFSSYVSYFFELPSYVRVVYDPPKKQRLTNAKMHVYFLVSTQQTTVAKTHCCCTPINSLEANGECLASTASHEFSNLII